tara:strand:+ start:687 stop:971 length:285 start_codon:yes stop_codon:yes gene_type:complete
MRYRNDRIIKGGSSLATNQSARRLRLAAERGLVSTVSKILGSDMRLDQLAFQYLGDPALWWAIAALSNIGWGLQLPAGTRIVIPTSIEEVKRFA